MGLNNHEPTPIRRENSVCVNTSGPHLILITTVLQIEHGYYRFKSGTWPLIYVRGFIDSNIPPNYA